MIAGLIAIGLILVVSALKNTQHKLGEQLERDILGTDGFFAWALAVMGLGAVGYVPGLERTSRYLLLLVGVVMVLRNGGIFQDIQEAIQDASKLGPAPAVPALKTSADAATGSGSGGSGGGSNPLGQVASIAQIASIFA